MASKDTMYIILDDKMNWIYNIVDDLDEAIDTARMMNDEENPKYHHYVVQECSQQYGTMWQEAWKKVTNK